jgi:oligopeptide/dipeptide ABC transporter ATP-binding protein
VFADPQHPYTEALMRSVPSFGASTEKLAGIEGRPPDPRNFPPGCRFEPRCGYAQQDCPRADHALVEVAPGRATACIHPELLKGVES